MATAYLAPELPESEGLMILTSGMEDPLKSATSGRHSTGACPHYRDEWERFLSTVKRLIFINGSTAESVGG